MFYALTTTVTQYAKNEKTSAKGTNKKPAITVF